MIHFLNNFIFEEKCISPYKDIPKLFKELENIDPIISNLK